MKKFFSLLLTYLVVSSCITAEAISFVAPHFSFSSITNEKLNIKNEKIIEGAKSTNVTTTSSKKIEKNLKEDIEVFNHNGSSLEITKADIDLLAKLVYCESRGEPFTGKVAVASVVLNRVTNPKFPDTIEKVVFQKNAFSCVINGKLVAKPDQSCYDAVYEAIRGKDPTNDALFFYNPSIATCTWMKETSKKDSKKIGNHTFFKQ
ncbi:MAG: cell wall hydrolase [Clostridium sp.]|uniref:cell wall hydrolase n=1 Tax=Clostridium TaxID=1485 RepID=UPI0021534590|nr:cell wall hydrolase [Clostridium sp. LY3-2]MCR6514723.1 cell wall hydrolase [Clostridium sp. LY3-2]